MRLTRAQQMAQRRQSITEVERVMLADRMPEDSLFYCHPNDDHIILSHALFWVLTKSLVIKLQWNENFLLLRKFQEEMLTAYLTESEEFDELFHFCNVMYEVLPYYINSVNSVTTDKKSSKACRQLMSMAVVAVGYGGDLDEDSMYDLLDDIDFHYNKVKCAKIEQMLPWLYKKVEEEMEDLGRKVTF